MQNEKYKLKNAKYQMCRSPNVGNSSSQFEFCTLHFTFCIVFID